jgi:hypothetical protein
MKGAGACALVLAGALIFGCYSVAAADDAGCTTPSTTTALSAASAYGGGVMFGDSARGFPIAGNAPFAYLPSYFGPATADVNWQTVKTMFRFKWDWTAADAQALIKGAEKTRLFFFHTHHLKSKPKCFGGAMSSSPTSPSLRVAVNGEPPEIQRYYMVGTNDVWSNSVETSTREVLGQAIKDGLCMGADLLYVSGEGAAVVLRAFGWGVGISNSVSVVGGAGAGTVGNVSAGGLGVSGVEAGYRSKPWLQVVYFKLIPGASHPVVPPAVSKLRGSHPGPQAAPAPEKRVAPPGPTARSPESLPKPEAKQTSANGSLVSDQTQASVGTNGEGAIPSPPPQVEKRPVASAPAAAAPAERTTASLPKPAVESKPAETPRAPAQSVASLEPAPKKKAPVLEKKTASLPKPAVEKKPAPARAVEKRPAPADRAETEEYHFGAVPAPVKGGQPDAYIEGGGPLTSVAPSPAPVASAPAAPVAAERTTASLPKPAVESKPAEQKRPVEPSVARVAPAAKKKAPAAAPARAVEERPALVARAETEEEYHFGALPAPVEGEAQPETWGP